MERMHEQETTLVSKIDGKEFGSTLREKKEAALTALAETLLAKDRSGAEEAAFNARASIGGIRDLWILINEDKAQRLLRADVVWEIRNKRDIPVVAEYESNVLIFPAVGLEYRKRGIYTDVLLRDLEEEGIRAKLIRCDGLSVGEDLGSIYRDAMQYAEDAGAVFPDRKWLSIRQIRFAKKCRELLETEPESDPFRGLIHLLDKGREGDEILRTLSCYFLDTDCSITETANVLYIHKNTVKYRIARARDLLGFRVGEWPESMELSYALGVRRLAAK